MYARDLTRPSVLFHCFKFLNVFGVLKLFPHALGGFCWVKKLGLRTTLRVKVYVLVLTQLA